METAVEVVKRLRVLFEQQSGDRRVMGDADALAETIAPYATDDFICVMQGLPTTTHEGVEGLRAAWRDFLSAFDTIEIVPGELRGTPDGNAAAEFVRLIGRPTGTTGEIDQQAAAVWRTRDGALSAVEFHIDQAEALRSAGLDPADPGPPAG